ncbi:MAG: type III pantothenate kinase [Methylococcales bacterium]|nr:type III pantothenate kinase [Methylococcales bacterium]
MKLLLDIGNTRIKWCVEKNGEIGARGNVSYKLMDFSQEIQQYWSKLDAPQLLAISSVSAKEIRQQLVTIAKQNWPDINVFIAKSSVQACSVTSAYQDAEKLGVDRWLGLIALRHYYPEINCIVDCGTAITLDCLDETGQHLGGLISPGVQLMKKSLYQGTEDLGFINKPYSLGLADSTDSAVYTGTIYAAAGLIEKAVRDLCQSKTLVLTGGDAELIANTLKLEVIVEPDFVFKGLSLLAKEAGV